MPSTSSEGTDRFQLWDRESVDAPVATSTTLVMGRGGLVVHKVRVHLTLAGRPIPEITPALVSATSREARWLAAARHSGVVALTLAAPRRATIETRFAGAGSLRTLRLAPSDYAHILQTLVDTLEHLHHRGLFHGNLRPEHVVIKPGRKLPVLCSPSGQSFEPRDDVVGLAGLIGHGLTHLRPPDTRGWAEIRDHLVGSANEIDMAQARQMLYLLDKPRSSIRRLARRLGSG